jgi:hypothetical protein
VNHDLDVLISETPNFHLRRPDVVVYRCIDADRGKWGRKPYASDCLLVLEIVSANSVTTDIRHKRAEYAAAGIPHYWIVRMTDKTARLSPSSGSSSPWTAITSGKKSQFAAGTSTRSTRPTPSR